MAATLKAKATLDDSKFQTALRRMQTRAGTAAKTIGRGMKAGAVVGVGALGTAAGFAAKGLVHLTTGAIDNAAALQKASKMTGVAVKDLAILQDTFEENESGLDQLTSSLVKMERALSKTGPGAKKVASDLAEMGIPLDEFLEKSAADKFIALSQGISKLTDPIKKAGLATRFFGKAGADLLPIMEDISNTDMTGRNEEAETLSGMAQKAKDLKALQAQLKDSAEQFATGFGSGITDIARDLYQGALLIMGDTLGKGKELSAEVRKFMGYKDKSGAREIGSMTSVGKDPFKGFTTAHSRKSDFLDYATAKSQGISEGVTAPKGSLISGGLQSGSLGGASMAMGTKGAAWGGIRRGDAARHKEQDRLKAIEALAKRQAEAAERTADAVEEVVNN